MSNDVTEPVAFLSRDMVAARLAVPASLLVRYEARGLVHMVRQGSVEGYEPAEIRRVWAVVSLHRDLGINLAGIEAVLRLRSQLEQVHERLGRLAKEMQAALDARSPDDQP